MSMQRQRIPMESLVEILMLQMEKGGRADLTVTGWSMHPMLRNRWDKVTLIPPQGKLKKKDIILYRRENGQYVLHRIIDVENETYILSGDNQAMREPVDHAQVIAVVSGFTHKGKPCSMKSFSYQLYTFFMVDCFFFRRPYLILRRRLGRFFGQLRKKLK